MPFTQVAFHSQLCTRLAGRDGVAAGAAGAWQTREHPWAAQPVRWLEQHYLCGAVLLGFHYPIAGEAAVSDARLHQPGLFQRLHGGGPGPRADGYRVRTSDAQQGGKPRTPAGCGRGSRVSRRRASFLLCSGRRGRASLSATRSAELLSEVSLLSCPDSLLALLRLSIGDTPCATPRAQVPARAARPHSSTNSSQGLHVPLAPCFSLRSTSA